MRPGWALVLMLILFTGGCEQLLPDRSRVASVSPPATDSAPPPADSPRPRQPRPPPDTATVNESEAFGQLRRGLRRLVAAQQGFYAENGTYTEDLERLGYRGEGQTALKFLWLRRDGWAASATHPSIPGRDCVIFVGPTNAAPTTLKYVRSAREGVAACDETPPRARAPGVPPAPAPAAADTASALDAVSPSVQMRVDLRNLALSQNAYFSTQGVYSRRIEPLALQYLWHRGVHVKVLSADTRSWAARATHASRPGRSCVVWYGPVPTRPATDLERKVPDRAGVPVCDS